MASATSFSKPNIAVYTNPNHDLWIADATPSVEDVNSGKSLKEGEVMVEVRSTGICGYAINHPASSLVTSVTANEPAPMSTSGTLAASALWSSRGITFSVTNLLAE